MPSQDDADAACGERGRLFLQSELGNQLFIIISVGQTEAGRFTNWQET